jgi:ribosomal protein S12 methylthiotransferase
VARNQVTTELTLVAGCDMPRINSMPKYTAYLKIAEGCDNACAFCIIPTLRGKQRSRTVDDLVREAQRLAREGVVELNLIAQDLTGYGHDLPGKPTLADLLAALSNVDGIRWVRCMYAYPRTLSDELMEQLASSKNVLPYLDIPTQHGSDRMLRRMRRGKDQKRLSAMLTEVRAKVQNAVLRSTVIVGFPGEDDDDFAQLVAFADAVKFERLGVFKYSDEEGTAAFDLDGKLPYATKRARYDKLMRRQRRIHEANAKKLVGTVHEAIVEGVSEEHELLVKGRLWSQAPEIDGMTYLSSTRALSVGEIVHVVVTDVKDYDVVAEVLEAEDPRVGASVPFRARTSTSATRAA